MRFLVLLTVLFSFQVHAVPEYSLSQIAAINLTSAGTRQAISSTDVFCRCAVINALAANTGVVYLGDVAVTAANGLVLAKGDTAILCADSAQGTLRVKLSATPFASSLATIKIHLEPTASPTGSSMRTSNPSGPTGPAGPTAPSAPATPCSPAGPTAPSTPDGP